MNVLVFLLFGSLAFVLVIAGLTISRLVAPQRPGGRKQQTYECGVDTIGTSRIPFSVGYYLLALVFLVFDVEAAFLFPWTVVVREMGGAGLLKVSAFVVILAFGLAYAWRKGALKWA